MSDITTVEFPISAALRRRMKLTDSHATLDVQLTLPDLQTIASVTPVVDRYQKEVKFAEAFLQWTLDELDGAEGPLDLIFPFDDLGVYDLAETTLERTGIPIGVNPPDVSTAVRVIDSAAITGRARYFPSPGAVQFWFKGTPVGAPTTIATITDENTEDTLLGAIHVLLLANGRIRADFYNTAATPAVVRTDTGSVAVNDDAWHHIVVNDTGSTITVITDEVT